ncbi:4'-phosphopantetheinyl transferase superfamily protein [Kitasatospora sp. NPDC088548]
MGQEGGGWGKSPLGHGISPRAFVYDEAELAAAEAFGPDRAREFLAGRSAAKEAVLKALGTGFTGGIRPRDVAVLRTDGGVEGVAQAFDPGDGRDQVRILHAVRWHIDGGSRRGSSSEKPEQGRLIGGSAGCRGSPYHTFKSGANSGGARVRSSFTPATDHKAKRNSHAPHPLRSRCFNGGGFRLGLWPAPLLLGLDVPGFRCHAGPHGQRPRHLADRSRITPAPRHESGPAGISAPLSQLRRPLLRLGGNILGRLRQGVGPELWIQEP